MAITAASLLGGNVRTAYTKSSAVQPSAEQDKKKNRGSLIGGVGYLGEKAVAGLVQSLEGIVDFGVGGIADLLGADAFAERQFKNDWFGDWYDTAGDWYNPSRGWKVAGDIAGGIGTSLPALAVSGIGIGIAAATGGAGTPLAVGLIAGSTAATAGLSAAGTATKEAYRKSGNLGLKEYGYGALVGVTEGAIEGVSNAIGVGTGAVVKSIAGGVGKGVAKGAAKGAGKAAFKSTIKSATASLGKHAILKTGVKAFAGEAFEEGVAELLSPIYARMTYDPEASLASPQEIAYAAFVGGMSGLVMGGATGTVNMARHNVSGNQIYAKGQAQSVVDGAKALLADAEKSGSMDTDAVKALKSVYDRFTASAGGTSADSLTGNQRRLLGQMNEASAAVVMNEAVISSAINIVQNAEQITKSLEAYNYTDENGNKVTFTAEQLREGILGNDGKIKRDAIATALKNNTALRTLAAADAAGRLMMDTATFADAMMQGTRVDEHSLNAFIENASEKKKAEVGKLLGVSDWNAVDAEEINARIGIYMLKGGAQIFEDRSLAVNAFEQHRGDKARAIPSSFKATKDGVYRYSSNGDNIAVSKYGDTYAIYDYDEKVVTRDLTRAELNRILAKHAREVKKSTESAAKPETVAEEGQTQEQPSASLDANETAAKEKTAPEKSVVARAREIAETKVKGYDKLSERNKSMVRKVIRQGIVKGIPEELLIDFANVSAHAKVDVVFDKDLLLQGRTKDGREVYANGAYDPHSDKIYINPDVPTSDGILIHELDHAIRKTVKGGKVTTEIHAKALKAAGVDTYEKIADRYLGKAKNMTLEERVNKGKIKSLAEKLDVVEDEVEAYYAQTVLGSRGIIKHLVSETPSLKQRILDFFKGAKADYRDVPNLDRQAAKYYRQYKKWFDEYAGNRRYKTMGDAAYANNTDTRFSLIGRTKDGRGIYRTNYPENTPKDVKQKDIVDLVQNVWSKKPIKLNLVIDGKEIPIEARFNPELTERSDLSKIAFGNRKGTASEKRITMNLSSDLYQIAEESHHVGSKTESGKDNASHEGVTTWHYFLTDLVYVEADGTEIECYMNIDVKQNDSGHWFYSFAIEKGSRPADVLSVVTDKSATTSTISITENAEKSNPSDEISLKKSSKPAKDSLGNTLTKEQADYFKDSKVRDKDGNLLAMYQGSAEEFYTFDRKKSKPSNLYGRGFYFTNSEDQARHYGKTRAFYLGVNNPVSTTERTITRSQMRKFLESVAENEDYSIENYGTYDVAKVLSSVYDGGRSDFAMLQDVNSTAIGDLVEAIELFNDINGTAYDGIILDTEVVTFRSNQAKLISNKKPTVNPDMRMSLPLDGEEIAVEVEERNDLIAVHNLSEANLNRVLDIGGFPMPSIAVTAPELSHSNYGDISVVFGRETIDPEATSKNVVYDRDAWTPTAPRVDVKLDAKRVEGLTRELESIVSEYPEYKRDVDRFFDGNYRDNKGDYIVPEYDYRKESIGRYALEYPGLMAGYLLEQGKEIKPIYKETTYDVGNTTYTRSEAGELLEYVGITKDVTRNNITESKRQEILEKLKRYRADQIYNRIGKDLEYSKILEMVEGSVGAGYVSELLFMSEQYFRDDAGKKRYDAYATREKLQSEITDNDAFETWVFDKIQGTMERKGIRKDVEVFDSRGRRKTFAQTHDEYNVESIVKAMSKGAQEGNATFGMTAGALAANLSRQFKSVEDIRQARKYLKRVSEEDLNAFKDKTYELYDELVSRIAGSRGDLFSDGRRRDEVGEILGKCAKVRPFTVEGIKRKFDSETRGYDLGYTFDDAEAGMAMTLFETLKHVPTTYFEAKPRRVVNFSEIKMVELPYSASEALKAKLSERRIPYEVYGKTDAERSAAINRLKDVSFSLPESEIDESASKSDGYRYTYDALVKKGDILVVKLLGQVPKTEKGSIDIKKVVSFGRENALKQNNPNNTKTNTYVYVDDIGIDVLLSKSGMVHGIARSEETALAVMQIGDLLKNSIAVNELEASAERKTEMSYVLLGVGEYGRNRYLVRSLVSKLENSVTEIDIYQLGALKSKKIETPTSAQGGTAVTEQSSLISSVVSKISIADFFENVKSLPLANESFSADVLKKLGVSRSKGTISDSIRFSKSLDADESAVELESVTAPSIPSIAGEKLTVGQMRKLIANASHYKMYSKKNALIVVKQFDGADLLTQKTQDELATVLWKRLNEAKNRTEMKTYAHDVAEYILSRVMSEAKVEKTGAAMDAARARLSALHTYIGKVTFTESEIEEIRHVKDKKGLRQILGRWGYKSSRGDAKVPLDVFVTDIVGENADLAYLKELHPVDAFLELDSIYEDVKNTVNDKWESVYYDVNDEGLAQIVQDMENDILLAFEYLGEETEYKRRITSIVDRYKRRSDYWKAEHDKVNKVSRWHNIVADQAQKLKDIATHRFANATQIENDTLDQSIGDLAKVIRRGNISVTKVREVCDKLLMLYNSKPFRENVLEYFDENNAGYYNGLIETYLEVLSGAESVEPDGYEYKNSNGKSLSATELRMLSSVLSYFQNLYENYGKVWRRGQLVEALPLAQEFIGIAKSNSALPMGKIKSALARMTKSAPVQTFADPASVIRRIDLYQHGFYTEMFEQLREAAYNAEIAQMRVMKEYDEFLRENKGYMKKASRETVEFRGEKISKIKLVSLYCASKRKQAQAGLAINGYQYTGLSGDVIRVDGALDANAAYTEEEIGAEISKLQRELEKHLTAADKKYIALLENIYNNEARQLKVNRDLERNGFTNVEEGYYYPIRRANTATSVDKEMQGEIDRVSNASFNKDVVKGAKQEVLIESADDLIRRHVYAVCQYAHLSPVIDSYNRIYNLDTVGNKDRPVSVRTETRNVWAEGDAYMRKMFSDIQGITENGAGSKILSYIRGSYAISALAANPKVWATQLSSFAAASSLLDADLIFKGAFASRQNLKDIFTYCPVAELRAYENTAAMAQAVVDNKGKARGAGSRALGATQKFGQFLMTPIGLVDKNVIKRLFGACQLQVQRNSGGEIKVGTERNKIEAGKLLTRVIFETQQNTLSTEKSAAMRSGNEIYKTLTMFSADAMKVVGRVFDSFGELVVLKERIKQATDPKVKSELQARLKVVKRSARKATVAIVATSVYMTALSLAFRRLYNKDEEETVPALIAETFGNMLGGLPVIRDVYSLILDGYDIDHYAYSAVNDMVKGMMSLGKAAAAFVSGDGSRQDLARSGKNVIFSVSQLTGIPARNFYNVTYGLTKRFSPSTAYKIDSVFYEKNYANDLTKALEDGDTDMANMIYSILYNERVGVDISDEALSELHGLAARGYKVLPRKVSSEITLDGVEYALSGEEQAAIQSEYARRLSSLDALVSSSRFQAMTDEEKEYAAQYLFDICYKSAEASVLGIDRGNAAILANVISAEKLTVLATKANAIKAEGDERRKKTVAMIKAMNATQAEKLIMICLRGYSVKDGDIPGVTAEKAKEIMLKYILSASITKAQKEKLAKMCGFTVRDGKILQKSK